MNLGIRKDILSLLTIIIGLFTTSYSFSQTITSNEVEMIRNRNLLRNEDMGMIKTYIIDQINSIVDDRNPFDTVLKLQAINKSKSQQAEVQKMYSDEYSKAIIEGVESLQSQLNSMENQTKAESIFLSSVLILANTDNALAVDKLLELAASKNVNVKYHALKGLTKPALYQYFSSPEGSEAYQKVTTALTEILSSQNKAEIIGQIAKTAILTTDQGISLLESCVAKRAEQYKKWYGVGNELVEYEMLVQITNTIQSGANADAAEKQAKLMHIASEIYNLAWQRYYLGSKQTKPGTEQEICIFDNTPSKSNLLTILIDGENRLATLCEDASSYKMTGNNLLRNSWQVLERRMEKVVGIRGVIQEKFNIYGSKSEIDLTVLSAPPAEMVQNSINLAGLSDKILEIE